MSFSVDDLWRIIEAEGLDIVEVRRAIKEYSARKREALRKVVTKDTEPVNNLFNYEQVQRLEKKGVKH